jgi:hypothetical protein
MYPASGAGSGGAGGWWFGTLLHAANPITAESGSARRITAERERAAGTHLTGFDGPRARRTVIASN